MTNKDNKIDFIKERMRLSGDVYDIKSKEVITMVNRINEVLGGLYYVDQADKAARPTQVDKTFKSFERERVEKIQRITNLGRLSEQEKQQKPNEFLKTEIVEEEQGKKSVVLTTNQYGYRQINLTGEKSEEEFSLLNPLKVKAAYFEDE